ncbi:MAG: rRNA maturation RNase YbeY [Beijerinckiaceae bacterium]|nr:rRNA maturation RNase YbeY [Beijerinckiaceae bacterium]
MITLDCVSESDLWAAHPEMEAIAERALAQAAASCGLSLLPGAEVALLLVDDMRMRSINKQWREKDKPTNVLSFPAVPVSKIAHAPFLGDIVLACETVEREAADEDKTFDDHAAHLVVHGFLHLIGHDHMNDEEAELMEGLETRILAELGIADPYADAGH